VLTLAWQYGQDLSAEELAKGEITCCCISGVNMLSDGFWSGFGLVMFGMFRKSDINKLS